MLQLPTAAAPRRRRSSTPIAREYRKLQTMFAAYVAAEAGSERAFHRAQRRLLDHCVKLIGMPATGPADMLMKIAAAGPLMDCENWKGDLFNWRAMPTGHECDDAAPRLLVSIRDDIERMTGANL